LDDFKDEINSLWDRLPLDTVIASILDPRTKFYDKIPQNEIDEALKTLQEEFIELVRKNPEPAADDAEPMEMDVILNELIAESGQASLPTDIWQKEINSFRNELRPLMGSDPLDWWRKSQYRYPYLSKLARAYLGIPASQASCERLFSVGKDIITDKRCSLKPDLVESLIFISTETKPN